MDQQIEEILEFWYGPAHEADLPDDKRTHIWFGHDAEIDAYIKQHYLTTVMAASEGKLDHWQDTPRGMLALIIVLDQFSRNIYRASAMAFAQDHKALEICYRGLDREIDQRLSLIERVFFYMPLEHSEDLDDQVRSVSAFQSLMELALPETHKIFKVFYEYAVEHYRVIERYGRYPYRNAALGRANSAEEEEYLIEIQES